MQLWRMFVIYSINKFKSLFLLLEAIKSSKQGALVSVAYTDRYTTRLIRVAWERAKEASHDSFVQCCWSTGNDLLPEESGTYAVIMMAEKKVVGHIKGAPCCCARLTVSSVIKMAWRLVCVALFPSFFPGLLVIITIITLTYAALMSNGCFFKGHRSTSWERHAKNYIHKLVSEEEKTGRKAIVTGQ